MLLNIDYLVYCLFTGVVVESELIVKTLVGVDVQWRFLWRRDCVNLVYWRNYLHSEMQKTSSFCYELVSLHFGV